MNRRDFLRLFATATCTAFSSNCLQLFAEQSVPLSEDLVAIFSDTHLHGPETTQHVVRFNQSVQKILAMNPRPANLIIYGDIAYLEGKPEEYELFRQLIKPVEQAGIRWEAAMGNHDRIKNFRQFFPERFEKPSVIEGRYINIVKTPHADFIVLDSYMPGAVRGQIEPRQKQWLKETLDKYNKPVFVGCHHPLKETELADVLRECPHLSAYLYGHNHNWVNSVEQQVQTIGFPSVGHWGDMGFVMLKLTEKEAVFTPDIDAYLFPKWSKTRTRETNVEAYLKRLNETTVRIPLR